MPDGAEDIGEYYRFYAVYLGYSGQIVRGQFALVQLSDEVASRFGLDPEGDRVVILDDEDDLPRFFYGGCGYVDLVWKVQITAPPTIACNDRCFGLRQALGTHLPPLYWQAHRLAEDL